MAQTNVLPSSNIDQHDENFLPLLLIMAVTASLLHLGYASTAKQSRQSATVLLTVPRPDDRVLDYDKISTTSSISGMLRRKSLRRRILLVIECIALVASTATALSNRKSHFSVIDAYFWLYLTVIYLIGVSPLLSSHYVRLVTRQTSAFLYTVRWLVTVWLYGAQPVYHNETLAWPLLNVGFVATTILLLVHLSWPRSLPADRAAYPDATRESHASLLGMLGFAWVENFLFAAWYHNKLSVDQIPTLSPLEMATQNTQAFKQSTRKDKTILWRIICHFRTTLILQAVWAAVYGLLSFVPTLLLQSIMQHVEHATDTTSNRVWIRVALLFSCSVLASVAESRSIWLGQKIGFRLRSIMISEIYGKALRRPAARQATTKQASIGIQSARAETGAILNFVTTDAFKIADAGANMHQVWGSVPVQVIVAIILLYRTLGFSIFAGVALMIGVVPMNSRIAQRFGAIQMQVMAASDGRIQSTTEVIRCIRIIKFFAWELHFEQQIEEKRRHELKALRSRYILWSIAASIWYGVPLLITFVSFFMYSVVLGKALTPSLAFTALSLFNLLKMPLDDFVGMITRIQDTLSSIQRVETFLKEEETEKYIALTETQHEGLSQVGFEHATISWGDMVERASDTQEKEFKGGFTLKDLHIHFAIGKLNLITGATGSGKSSMLLALLGEMKIFSGRILMPSTMDRNELTVETRTGLVDGVAYCAQEAWLTNDTIRNNIIFGSSYVEERYKAVLEACALDPDLHALADGDLTHVGERGVSLSGGQKQRIALARAVYSTAYHLLLDDCLSAVDSHTGTWIFENCLMGPLVRGRTVILATHNIALTGADADFVVILGHGKVIATGSPFAIKSSHQHPEFENLDLRDEDANRPSRLSIHSLKHSMKPIQPSRASLVLIQREIAHGSDENATESEKIQNNGSIPWASVLQYLGSMGNWVFWSLLILSFVGQQVGAIGTNWWIRVLCDAYITRSRERAAQPTGRIHDVSVTYYFGVYSLIISIFLVVGMARLLLISYGSLHASSSIHTILTRSIMNARFDFFDKTASGKIINCFSRDLQMMDQDLAVLAVATLHFLVALLGITTLIIIITPAFLVPGIFIGIAYCIIGNIYIGGTRDLKQIDSAQRAPLSQHFDETLSGITTIRAFGAVGQYRLGNSIRVDNVNRSSFLLAATERWLAVRLGLVGAFVSLFAGLFAVSTRGKLNPSAIGLSMSYAVVFSEHVLWLIRYHIANLNNMMALARVQNYMDLPQEAPAVLDSDNLTQGWPSLGEIRYENVSARYAPESDAILHNIAFIANPLERVGIVGRTGAGKSSLLLTLLRGLEVEGGRILIDDVDIKQVGLRLLRRSLAIVPQDPTLFAGTLRFNLDPFNVHSDAELLMALESVGLRHSATDGDETLDATTKQNKFSDLSFMLVDSGSNISQGQRQLVCIARVLLKAPKIVVLDEATASIDHETDLRIQNCVRRLDATVISIAHRIRTVIDYDRIVVLDDGKVKECDHPWMLLQDKNSAFYAMCKMASDSHTLFTLAESAWHSDRKMGGK